GDYILINDGNPKLAFIGDLTSALVNIFVDIIGVRFFHMGIGIVAFGTVFGSICCFFIYLLHFRKKDRLCRIVRPQLKEDDPGIIDIIKPGSAESLLYILIATQIIVQNAVLVAEAGTSGLDNATIADDIQMIYSIIITSATDPVMTFAAAYFGEQNRMGLNLVKRKQFIIGGIMLLPFVVLTFGFPEIIPAFYKIDDPFVISSLPIAIRYITVTMILFYFTTMFVDYLAATEEENKANLSLVISSVSMIALPFLLQKLFSYNSPWIAKVIAELLQLIFLLTTCRFFMRGLIKFQKENVLFLDGGEITGQHTEKWIEGIKVILGEEEAEAVRIKMLYPIINSPGQNEHLMTSFTVLQRNDNSIAVILRYDPKKDQQQINNTATEADNKNGEVTNSEFLGIRRVMMIFERKGAYVKI
ncbi:MAG: hypothetical protein K6B28_07035, partial [Lachnospiraceae bacterium]|nr:hypothetical protein [Lachnospiraceae bacterium]